jgi:GNAT superfamily N-acetyltransferase
MPTARIAGATDLEPLLELYPHVSPNAPALPAARAREIWAAILAREGTDIYVADADGMLVASCMLITAPNLLRGGRQHGFIENVVTHAGYRRRGYGRAVIQAALDTAWAADCHHVLLQSGRPDPGVHRFYEDCGFVPGVRIGYVARRPTGP